MENLEFLNCEGLHDPGLTRVDLFSYNKFMLEFDQTLMKHGFKRSNVAGHTVFKRLLLKYYGLDVEIYANDPLGTVYMKDSDLSWFVLKWKI